MVSGLEAVFLNHRQELLRFLRARGAGPNADDLLQELWLKVSSLTVQPVSDPLAYLYRMANNLMLDRNRGEMRRSRREQDWMESAGDAPSDGSDVASGERVVLAQQEMKAVQEALSALGERTEAIFRRFRLEGVTQHQIASDMGISISAVEKHLQKAYRALVEVRRRLDAE